MHISTETARHIEHNVYTFIHHLYAIELKNKPFAQHPANSNWEYQSNYILNHLKERNVLEPKVIYQWIIIGHPQWITALGFAETGPTIVSPLPHAINSLMQEPASQWIEFKKVDVYWQKIVEFSSDYTTAVKKPIKVHQSLKWSEVKKIWDEIQRQLGGATCQVVPGHSHSSN